MTVTLLYVAHNRLEYTAATFANLLQNTNWEHVKKVIVTDDHSTDGTAEYLAGAISAVEVPHTLISKNFGGPVAALNRALDICETEYIAKIDSDLIVCPDWLDTMLTVLKRDTAVDALGMEPGFAGTVQPLDVPRHARSARWIGGQGLFRTRCFARRRPVQNERFFGLTQHWRKHAVTAWVDPDLPVFNLDHLPMDPWRSLAKHYLEQGWSRRWDPYSPDMARAYAGWWLDSQQAEDEAAHDHALR